MLTEKILLILLKDFSSSHTITSFSKSLRASRVGIWKILKKLEADELITLNPVGKGKTSIFTIKPNWNNIVLEKKLELYLTQESQKQKRWQFNFKDLKSKVNFLILYGSMLHSPKEANDIDIVGVADKKRIGKIGSIILNIQRTQIKKIHSINFTPKEFKEELKKPNKAFTEAVKKGTILFGQESFIKFMKEL